MGTVFSVHNHQQQQTRLGRFVARATAKVMLWRYVVGGGGGHGEGDFLFFGECPVFFWVVGIRMRRPEIAKQEVSGRNW